jgi:hypothetical protein
MRIVSYHRPLLSSSPSIKINPKLYKMVLKCSNPLICNTKECLLFWSEIETFNTKILEMEYEINNISEYVTKTANNEVIDYFGSALSEECLMNSDLEGCKVYDI